jgi:glutamine synthetase
MTAIEKFIKQIQDNNIEFVDFRFTDIKGKLHHITHHVSTVDTDLLTDGLVFDGSSINGWRAINESDMVLKPDLAATTTDPFTSHATLNVLCDVFTPQGQPYSRCPRAMAKAAENYLQSTGLADTAYFGPEAEFFVFDDVRFQTAGHAACHQLNSSELPHNSGADYPEGNLGHRPRPKGGYVPTAPVDHLHDVRAEMLSVLAGLGVAVEKHHHEVAPAQCELGVKFDTLVNVADTMQAYKYVVHNVAENFGKTATFMPKPLYGDNGSGMHCHQSLFKNGQPVFAGNAYAGLSETALYYIGGIIKHARALNAFTNPTTNSYKRLVPGYEAPVLLAYSACNRSASCRIPHATSPKGKRVEVRFPDPAANPYLAFAAMLMAGLDGINNKIHPGVAMDQNLYELSAAELAQVPQVCGSLREALQNLKQNHEFLLQGNVFDKEFIDSYIEMQMADVLKWETTPHPLEFEMYYSV